MCIAFAFGMSTALEVTDVAQGIADIFTTISERIGGRSASFVAIYVATALLSGRQCSAYETLGKIAISHAHVTVRAVQKSSPTTLPQP